MLPLLPLLLLTALLATEPAPEGDTVCGPRCVQAILRSYGQETELVDLVRELHTDGVEKGTTLGQMRDAFQSRGLYAAVVHLPAGAKLTWTEPAIVHLKPLPPTASGRHESVESPTSKPASAPRALGHFVIYLGDENGTSTNHDPLTGTLHGPREELLQQMSGDLVVIPSRSATELAECPSISIATASRRNSSVNDRRARSFSGACLAAGRAGEEQDLATDFLDIQDSSLVPPESGVGLSAKPAAPHVSSRRSP